MALANVYRYPITLSKKMLIDNLPKEIMLIQEELEYVTNELKKSNMYLENHSRYIEITKKMEILNKELTLKEDRWLEVLEIEESIKNG